MIIFIRLFRHKWHEEEIALYKKYEKIYLELIPKNLLNSQSIVLILEKDVKIFCYQNIPRSNEKKWKMKSTINLNINAFSASLKP